MEEESVDVPSSLSCKERCTRWMKSPTFSVYTMKALSSWGDRMWMFAVGLYLVKLSGTTLTLTAIYGLTGGVCVILLGALLGDWVDKNPRLKVARTSLVIQNTAVIVSAVILCVVLTYYNVILTTWPVHLANICAALIISTAIVSKLASIATKIAVEKDWVVVMCSGNKDTLSVMNASMRRIDLLCNILAPALVGQIMTFVSMVMGAIVIAAWNLVSVFLEYYLLWKIYKAVPNLAVKTKTDDKKTVVESPGNAAEKGESEQLMGEATTDCGKNKEEQKQNEVPVKPSGKPQKSLFELVFGRFLAIYKGWGVYMKQKVLPAGLAFACEFMTVLAFDSITSGFAFSQGLAEYIIGLLMAAGAITGIAGTFVFPVLRRRLGLERTGLVAFTAFIGCLILCVVSIWSPGSPFDPTFSKAGINRMANSSCEQQELVVSMSDGSVANINKSLTNRLKKRGITSDQPLGNLDSLFIDTPHVFGHMLGYLKTYWPQNVIEIDREDYAEHRTSELGTSFGRHVRSVENGTALYYSAGSGNRTVSYCSNVSPSKPQSFVSIGLLMGGIVCARFGLWLSDLTITQVFQENVAETERGVVGGVQSSLNMLMDVLRYLMVVIAPRPETYGILILISFFSICLGGCLFAYYARKTQGFLCVEQCSCCRNRQGDCDTHREHTPVSEL